MDVSGPENSSSCYLETEPHNQQQYGFQCILADNSYDQFKHLKGGESENVHPYKEEIEGLLKNLKTEFVELFHEEVTKIENTECVWVKTTSELEELAEVLSKERVFGVDTEQHGFRSFLGFTCLIQISTTSKDYLVDAIALHDVMGILRPVFADPRICKVFHGAGNDILWLQRDFHIYVVNLFDTAKASEVLWKKGTKSFAYLIEKYFKVSKDKTLQTGDWRPRPLSEEQVHYARTDSHYLVPVAHRLVSDLKSNSMDLVLDTIHRSNVLCLELYKKDTKKADLGESAAASIISRLENPERFHYKVCDTTLPCSCLSKFGRIVRRLCAWREIMARVHDESLSFILSELAIGKIAASLPTTETEMHSTISAPFDKSMHPSPVVSSHFEDFGRLILLDSSAGDDDFGHTILQWRLGSKGNCPLSLYNRNLLSGNIPKVLQSNRPVLDPCGFSAKRKNTERSEMFGLVYDSDWQLLWEGSQSLAKAYRNRYNGKLVSHGRDNVTILPGHEDECSKHVCVRCNKSSENKLKPYQIIPNCYEEWFPVRSNYYKETKLVCKDCHAIVNAAATQYKQQMAKEFGIILGVIEASSEVRTSSVVSSHLEDFGRLILLDSSTEDDDFGHTILQWRLESKGKCPLSMYNRNLLSGTIPKVLKSNTPGINPCGSSAKRKKIEGSEKVKYGRAYDSEGQFLWEGSQSMADAYANRYNGKRVPWGDRSTNVIFPGHEDGCNEQKVCFRCNKSSENELKCYQIMPHCYEVWFPVRSMFYQETKLLCKDCHAVVNAAATKCKQQIAREFGIIIGLIEVPNDVRKLALALWRSSRIQQNGERMPRKRVEEMTKTVNKYYEGR